MASNKQLLSFYYGEGPDTRCRFLREILNWPDDELERTHDFIQWLFPLDEPSGFNLDAPILDVDTIRKFRLSPPLHRNLQTSLLRMLRFYGFEMRHTVPLRVVCAPDFAERAANWITPNNHNHLRITRILKSLRLLGLKTNASAFYDCLLEICRQEFEKASPCISHETCKYWQPAAS
ncbi:MAG TPA: opioid growth factor receptor-related protein [Candidatus Dormibacteraeota bacterium]|nr:opioid growth factor receptor-related protein [Candidatus Dormibacteraeota bacterium]